jgi:hypothetical protein
MNIGALVFMVVVWAAVLWLNIYCFSKLLRNGNKGSE